MIWRYRVCKFIKLETIHVLHRMSKEMVKVIRLSWKWCVCNFLNICVCVQDIAIVSNIRTFNINNNDDSTNYVVVVVAVVIAMEFTVELFLDWQHICWLNEYTFNENQMNTTNNKKIKKHIHIFHNNIHSVNFTRIELFQNVNSNRNSWMA